MNEEGQDARSDQIKRELPLSSGQVPNAVANRVWNRVGGGFSRNLLNFAGGISARAVCSNA